MSKQAEADLILKLYELRREGTMRKARDWYFLEFNPESMADISNAMFSEHSGHLRMVLTYWDMAAALVNHGAIDMSFFNDANGEQIGVFSKVEPFLGEFRSAYNPQFLVNLEKLIDATPNGRKRTAGARERMKGVRSEIATRQQSRLVRIGQIGRLHGRGRDIGVDPQLRLGRHAIIGHPERLQGGGQTVGALCSQ